MRKAADEKVAGQQVTIAPEQPQAQIIDLFEALKQSLREVQSQATATGTEGGEARGGRSRWREPPSASAAKGPSKA